MSVIKHSDEPGKAAGPLPPPSRQGPFLFAGAEEVAATAGAGGGGGATLPPHLAPNPEPSGLPPVPDEMAAARLERYRAENETIMIKNQGLAIENEGAKARNQQELTADAKSSETEIKERETVRKTVRNEHETARKIRRNEHAVFTGVTVIGVLLTAAATSLALLHGEPVFLTGTGAGLLVGGTGIFKLRRSDKEVRPD